MNAEYKQFIKIDHSGMQSVIVSRDTFRSRDNIKSYNCYRHEGFPASQHHASNIKTMCRFLNILFHQL